MTELLHLGAVFPALLGVCCTIGGRQWRARAVVPGLVMLLAMLDLSVGPGLLAPLLWAAIMIGVAIWTAAGARAPDGAGVSGLDRAGSSGPDPARASGAELAGVSVTALGFSIRNTASGLGSHVSPDAERERTLHDGRLMMVHRALGLLVMTAFTLMMTVPSSALSAQASGAHDHGGVLMPIATTGLAAYVVYTVWMIAAAMRGRSRLARTDAASMALMLVVMAGAMFA